MKIVIVGDGKVGFALAEQLAHEDHDVTVIDNNIMVLEESLDALDVMVVNGNGASLEIQRQADVQNSDLIIAATSSDEVNLLCCVLAKKLGCKNAISRVRNPDYTEQIEFMKEELGLAMTVNPERTAAKEIYRILQFPSFLRRDAFSRGRVEIVEFAVDEDSILVGKSLIELPKLIGMKILVCAVDRDGEVVIPNGRFVLEKGDKINVTAPSSELVKLTKKLGIKAPRVKSVIIIGGSRIARYLTEELLKIGISVKIIDNDREKCVELAQQLPGAVIVNADGTKQDVLIAEGLRQADAVVTLMNMDEENLIVSMFANSIGVPKTVTKVNRTEYYPLFDDLGIGSVVCPKNLTANGIIRYVRAMQNTSGGTVHTLHRIVDGRAEALEFTAVAGTKYLDMPLSSYKLKKNMLISCILRRGQIIIPSGSDKIMLGDSVVVVTTSDAGVSDLNEIFEEGTK